MIRRIHTFIYLNKSFKAWDITVWDYLLLLEDFSIAREKILTEFNKKIPLLTNKQERTFWNILLDNTSSNNKILNNNIPKKITEILKENNKIIEDFHIHIGRFMTNLHQQYSEILSMPLYLFRKLINDSKIIMWLEKYDPDRNLKEPNIKEFQEFKGINWIKI